MVLHRKSRVSNKPFRVKAGQGVMVMLRLHLPQSRHAKKVENATAGEYSVIAVGHVGIILLLATVRTILLIELL